MSYKLIVIAASNDAESQAGYSIVKSMSHQGHLTKLGPQANATDVASALSEHPGVPVFFTGHGKPSFWKGTDNKPVVDARTGTANLLDGRTVFSLACWTSCRLGPHLANMSATYIGYPKKVSAIPKNKSTDPVIIGFLSTLLELVKLLSADGDAELFHTELRKAARTASKALKPMRKLGTAYLEAAVAIQDWTEYCLIARNGVTNPAAAAPILQDMLNEGQCIEAYEIQDVLGSIATT